MTFPRVFAATMTAILVTATAASAEGRLTFIADGGEQGMVEMTERWRDGALRTDIKGMDAYMLLNDKSVYSVTSAGGKPMVIDLAALGDMPGAGSGQGPSAEQTGMVFPERINEMDAIGETRDIAGVTGQVYEVDWIDDAGTPRTDTAVLSDDPRLLEHQALQSRLIKVVSGDDPNPLLVEMEKRGLAALSFGDRYLVTEITTDAGPAGDFELPAEPMDFGNMMNMGNQ
jgi:hypothetical protein